MKKNIILALETGIYGGSICLLKNDGEIASWVSEYEQTKSDEYLESIKKLLSDSQVNINEIDKIVISEGPGSYTGLRIGFSIAKGLKMALGIEIEGISLLDEMTRNARPITIAALPFGKSEICWKIVGNIIDNNLRLHNPNPINFSHSLNFAKDIKFVKLENLILPQKLYNELLEHKELPNDDLNILCCDRNLARIIGTASENLISDERIKIMYPKTFEVK
jgi:tRNA threonylcarbamoyl adenosine modification protein YeaZ